MTQILAFLIFILAPAIGSVIFAGIIRVSAAPRSRVPPAAGGRAVFSPKGTRFPWARPGTIVRR